MAISKQLEKFLKQNKIKHQVIEHRKVFTAYDSAETQHLKLAEVAKAVLLKGKKQMYLAVLSAQHNCDFKALSKLVGDKVSIAKEKDITKNLKTKIGLIAPFGSLYSAKGGSASGGKIPLFADKKLIKNKKLNLPAGSYTESILINTKDYLKLENPTLGNFSIKK